MTNGIPLGLGRYPDRAVGPRLNSAQRFLALGKLEMTEARGRADVERQREASEKVFHALLEALAARVQKYGVPAPESHTELKRWLHTKRDLDLEHLFVEAYLKLHVGAYYRGWIDRSEYDTIFPQIERAIARVVKDAGRR